MSGQSIEFNIGSVGSDSGLTAFTVVARETREVDIALVFTTPDNKRKQGLACFLNPINYLEFKNILQQAAYQIENLTQRGILKSLVLSQISETKVRVNIGSIKSYSTELAVSLIVQADNSGVVLFYAYDTANSRKADYLTLLDEGDLNKLQTIIQEIDKHLLSFNIPVIQNNGQVSDKRSNPAKTRSAQELIRMKNGAIYDYVESPEEARIAIEELRKIKAGLNLQIRELSEKIKQIREEHADKNRRRGSKMQGGGWVGKIVRMFQTAERDEDRNDFANQLSPFGRQKTQLAGTVINIDKAIVKLQIEWLGR